jgi:hypothetical protein
LLWVAHEQADGTPERTASVARRWLGDAAYDEIVTLAIDRYVDHRPFGADTMTFDSAFEVRGLHEPEASAARGLHLNRPRAELVRRCLQFCVGDQIDAAVTNRK